MKYFVVFIFFVSSISIAIGLNCNPVQRNSTVLSRGRRHLDFMKATRVFVRANIKQLVLSWGTIWAHAIGFKANMNILNENKGVRPYRRDTYEVLRQLLDFHGFDGSACILKAFCTATRTSDGSTSNGMMFKLLRHIFKLDENDKKYFSYLRDENCDQILHHHCPLRFNNISPFTDDI